MSMHSDSFNCVLHNYVLSDVVLDKYSSDFFVTIVSLNNVYITKTFFKSAENINDTSKMLNFRYYYS